METPSLHTVAQRASRLGFNVLLHDAGSGHRCHAPASPETTCTTSTYLPVSSAHGTHSQQLPSPAKGGGSASQKQRLPRVLMRRHGVEKSPRLTLRVIL